MPSLDFCIRFIRGQKVCLQSKQFELGNNNETISLPFYDREIDDQRDRPKMDRNAKNWQMILSKIIRAKTGKNDQTNKALKVSKNIFMKVKCSKKKYSLTTKLEQYEKGK